MESYFIKRSKAIKIDQQFEVIFFPAIRRVLLDLISLYQQSPRKIAHGNLRNSISIVNHSPVIRNQVWTGDWVKGVQKDLSDLHYLFSTIWGERRKTVYFAQYLDSLKKLSKKSIIWNELMFRVDDPLFFETHEKLALMDKLHILIIKARLFDPDNMDYFVYKSELSTCNTALMNWLEKAKHSRFNEALTYQLKLKKEGKEGEEKVGVQAGEVDDCYASSSVMSGALKFLRNILAHCMFDKRMSVTGRHSIYSTFESEIGPVVLEIREVLYSYIQLVNSSLLVNSLFQYLQSSKSIFEDREVSYLISAHLAIRQECYQRNAPNVNAIEEPEPVPILQNTLLSSPEAGSYAQIVKGVQRPPG